MIKQIYQALGNYCKLAVGSGKDCSFDFEISDFCNNYNLNLLEVFNSLKYLEKEGYILMTDAVKIPSKIFLKIRKEDLYKFQVEHKQYDHLLKIILRSYSGLFTDFTKIDENTIAQRADMKKEGIINSLEKLHKLDVLTYLPLKNKPQIIFCQERLNNNDIIISKEKYYQKKSLAQKRLDAVIHFATTNTKCRSILLLEYFGEKDSKRCGQCDVCFKRNKIELNELEFDIILNHLKPLLIEKPCLLEELILSSNDFHEDKIIKVIQWLLDNKKIHRVEETKLKWISK